MALFQQPFHTCFGSCGNKKHISIATVMLQQFFYTSLGSCDNQVITFPHIRTSFNSPFTHHIAYIPAKTTLQCPLHFFNSPTTDLFGLQVVGYMFQHIRTSFKISFLNTVLNTLSNNPVIFVLYF